MQKAAGIIRQPFVLSMFYSVVLFGSFRVIPFIHSATASLVIGARTFTPSLLFLGLKLMLITPFPQDKTQKPICYSFSNHTIGFYAFILFTLRTFRERAMVTSRDLKPRPTTHQNPQAGFLPLQQPLIPPWNHVWYPSEISR